MPYPEFDRSALSLKPLSERTHDLDLSSALALDADPPPFDHPALPQIAQRIVAARRDERPVILMIGAHVLRSGVFAHLIDLLERRLVTHLAMNGGAAIHDFELALVGATTESVGRYVSSGQFGLWQETGELNRVAARAASEGLGFGEAVGREIAEGQFPHARSSVLAAAYRCRIPATIHVGIGYDIVHEHPNCDGAALGAVSYRDFLIFAHAVSALEGGVVLSAGSAVMAPEVFLKALAMTRNVAHQRGEQIAHFSSAVFDIVELGKEPFSEPPSTHPMYYFRPFKTLLVRTVADGGRSFYVQGPHRATLSNLHRLVSAAWQAT
jgi:hypothetical protein